MAHKQLINQDKLLLEQINGYAKGLEVLIESLSYGSAGSKRWVAIAKTHLQEGFMALNRSVANPDNF